MRKILLIALWSVISLSTFGQKKDVKVLAIGFYNCENFFDTIHDPKKMDQETTPTPHDYLEKVHNIAFVISKMGTDMTPDGPAIMGLVEIENDNVIKDLIAEPLIMRRNYKYCWYYTPDERGISTAMLYNPKYFQVISSEPLHVPLESIGQKRPTRDILHVFGVLAGGDTVHILVNHWPSKSGGESATAKARLVAANVDKKIIDSIQQKNTSAKIIVMGDFNDNPTSEGIVEVLNARAKIEKLTQTDIYNPWINMYKKGEGTESYHGEWNLIDQIMVTGAFIKNMNHQWSYYKSEIFKRDFLVYPMGYNKGLPHRSYTVSHVWDKGYSDHFPVLTYLIEDK